MDLIEMRQRRARAIEAARAIANRATAESRNLTTDERERFDRSMREAEELRGTIERGALLDDAERDLRRPVGDPIRPEPPGGSAARPLAPGYSFLRALRGLSSRDFRGCDRELEESDRIARDMGREPRGLFVPLAALAPDRHLRGVETRAIVKGAGSSLVATETFADEFIELLRPATRVLQAGASALPNLRGDVSIPRRTAGATVEWLAESADVTASTPTFDAVTMQPRTLAARVDVSRKMVLQSTPAIEDLTRQDMIAAIGQEIDRAALLGDGTGAMPVGIVEHPDVTTIVRAAADGAIPDRGLLLEMERAIGAANADRGPLALLVNAATRAKLKDLPQFFSTETPGNSPALWTDGPDGTGMVLGHRALASNLLPSNLEKGASGAVLSAAILGYWPDLLIGQWGRGVEVSVDPYTLGDRGAIVLRVFVDVDIAVRHGASFVVANDILTDLTELA